MTLTEKIKAGKFLEVRSALNESLGATDQRIVKVGKYNSKEEFRTQFELLRTYTANSLTIANSFGMKSYLDALDADDGANRVGTLKRIVRTIHGTGAELSALLDDSV